MSAQAAYDFFNKLYSNEQLRSKMEGEMGMDHDTLEQADQAEDRTLGDRIAQVGRKNGFDFDADEARDGYKIFLGRFSGNLQGEDAELSESDLQSVVGGAMATSTKGGSTCCKTC